MKKLLYITMSLLLATGIVACNDGLEVGEVDLGYLKLVESNVNFDYRAGTGTIIVDTDSAVTATLAADCTWATATVKGNTVTITVPEYTGLESRNSSVTLTAGGRSVVVPFSQISTVLQFSSTALSFGKQEGSQTITFTPDDAVFTATVPQGDQSWLSVEIAKESVVVSVKGNTGSERKSTISVVFGEQEVAIAVTQATSLSTSVTAIDFTEYTAGSQDFTFDVTEGVNVSVTSNADWVTPTLDMDQNTVTVAVSANDKITPRNAVVTLKTDGGVTADIAVTQVGMPLLNALVGNWVLEYYDYWDNTYYAENIKITLKSGNTINIAGILGGLGVPSANFDATFNPNNGTVSIAGKTIVNGVSLGGQPLYLNWVDKRAEPIVLTIYTAEDPLIMATPVAGAQADIWGIDVNNGTSWVFLTLHTIWTKQ